MADNTIAASDTCTLCNGQAFRIVPPAKGKNKPVILCEGHFREYQRRQKGNPEGPDNTEAELSIDLDLEIIERRIREIELETGNSAKLTITPSKRAGVNWWGYVACESSSDHERRYESDGESIQALIHAIAEYMTEY